MGLEIQNPNDAQPAEDSSGSGNCPADVLMHMVGRVKLAWTKQQQKCHGLVSLMGFVLSLSCESYVTLFFGGVQTGCGAWPRLGSGPAPKLHGGWRQLPGRRLPLRDALLPGCRKINWFNGKSFPILLILIGGFMEDFWRIYGLLRSCEEQTTGWNGWNGWNGRCHGPGIPPELNPGFFNISMYPLNISISTQHSVYIFMINTA